MRQHPLLGVSILKQVPRMEAVVPVILQHHERYDGQGYPAGLLGDDSSVLAQVLAVADAYEAMTSARPHRAGAGAEPRRSPSCAATAGPSSPPGSSRPSWPRSSRASRPAVPRAEPPAAPPTERAGRSSQAPRYGRRQPTAQVERDPLVGQGKVAAASRYVEDDVAADLTPRLDQPDRQPADRRLAAA